MNETGLLRHAFAAFREITRVNKTRKSVLNGIIGRPVSVLESRRSRERNLQGEHVSRRAYFPGGPWAHWKPAGNKPPPLVCFTRTELKQ